MITIKSFVFNPFQENTYILHDDTKESVIIDPGCCDERERAELEAYIDSLALRPVQLLNTHAHIDHVLGNRFVANRYHLPLRLHRADLNTLERVKEFAQHYQIPYDPSPTPEGWLEAGDQIAFGDSIVEVLFVPGHAPGHVAFANRTEGFVVSGDVLFRGSIGRTDIPGGDFEMLMRSIQTQILPLGDNVWIYPGHGPRTTIADEKQKNPYLR